MIALVRNKIEGRALIILNTYNELSINKFKLIAI